MWTYAHEAVRLAVATTLLVGGASKLVSPRSLASSLREVYGLATPITVRVARGVAGIELLAALLLAAGWMLPLGLVLVVAVGIGIVLFASRAMRRGATRPCGCFGESTGRPVGILNLIAGGGLLSGALLLIVPVSAEPAPAALMLSATSATALLAVMARDRDRLLAPFRRHFAAPAIGPLPTEPEVP